MDIDEAASRMNYLRHLLGSGIRGEEYKQAFAEYMQLKKAVEAQGYSPRQVVRRRAQAQYAPAQEAPAEAPAQEEIPWWKRRNGPPVL